MARHVIANMGAERGATRIFPVDETVRNFLHAEDRERPHHRGGLNYGLGSLSPRQIDVLVQGGVINWLRHKIAA